MAGVPSHYYFNPQPEDRELTYRSAMLPLGTYRNEDGTESAGLAWPGMITEPINALERLGSGGFSNPQDPAAQQDMTTLLLSLYGGNALRSMAAPAARYVGRDARMARSLERQYPGESAVADGLPLGTVLEELPGPYGMHNDGLRAVGPWGLRGERARVLNEGAANSDVPFVDPIEMTAANIYLDDPATYADVLAASNTAARHSFADVRRSEFKPIDGDLLSDTGRPSLMGAALASNEANLRKMAREDVAPAPSALSPSEAFYQKLPDDLLEFPAISSIRDQQRMLDYVDGLSKLADDNWTGTLHSDTGRPSLMGSALSSEQPNALERYYRNGFQTY